MQSIHNKSVLALPIDTNLKQSSELASFRPNHPLATSLTQSSSAFGKKGCCKRLITTISTHPSKPGSFACNQASVSNNCPKALRKSWLTPRVPATSPTVRTWPWQTRKISGQWPKPPKNRPSGVTTWFRTRRWSGKDRTHSIISWWRREGEGQTAV